MTLRSESKHTIKRCISIIIFLILAVISYELSRIQKSKLADNEVKSWLGLTQEEASIKQLVVKGSPNYIVQKIIDTDSDGEGDLAIVNIRPNDDNLAVTYSTSLKDEWSKVTFGQHGEFAEIFVGSPTGGGALYTWVELTDEIGNAQRKVQYIDSNFDSIIDVIVDKSYENNEKVYILQGKEFLPIDKKPEYREGIWYALGQSQNKTITYLLESDSESWVLK